MKIRAEVDADRQRAVEEFGNDLLAMISSDTGRFLAARLTAGRARQAQQLVGRMARCLTASPNVARRSLTGAAAGSGQEVELCLHPGDRRTQLMRGVGNELLLSLNAVRSIWNSRLSVTTTGAISRGTEPSSIGRKSSAERSAISSGACAEVGGRSGYPPDEHQRDIELHEIHSRCS